MSGDNSNSDAQLYKYNPSLAAAIIFVVLFALTTFLHTYQLIRTRTWSFISFCVGGYFQWIGYIGRAIGAQESPNWSLGPFILQEVLLLVAPALHAASIYMVLGRIIRVTDGQVHSIIRSEWLTKIFVSGDVLSFLMQGAGAGIISSGSSSSLRNGEHIVIGGLLVQMFSFSFFLIVGILFHSRMKKKPTEKAIVEAGESGVWEKHLYALYAGSALILVRSVFRLIEFAQGYDGYLASHEVYLYIFDSLLMLITMDLFAFVHPSEINAMLKGSKSWAVRRVVSFYSPLSDH